MLRKLVPSAPKLPWSSRWYYVDPGTPALAAGCGTIVRAEKLATGWCVIIDHGEGLGTGYHHMSQLAAGVDIGATAGAGQPLGVIGANPIGYNLAHLHFDGAINGVFQDMAVWMRQWHMISLADAIRRGVATSCDPDERILGLLD